MTTAEHRKSIQSFPQAMMDFFGKKPEHTTVEFMAELKALTDGDKAELRVLLKEVGYGLLG